MAGSRRAIQRLFVVLLAIGFTMMAQKIGFSIVSIIALFVVVAAAVIAGKLHQNRATQTKITYLKPKSSLVALGPDETNALPAADVSKVEPHV
jgi:hypothetical protein